MGFLFFKWRNKKIDEVIISRAITESFMRTFMDLMDSDVVIVGGGPSGIVCAYYLAKAGKKVVLFERHLKIGGGMPGGGRKNGT